MSQSSVKFGKKRVLLVGATNFIIIIIITQSIIILNIKTVSITCDSGEDKQTNTTELTSNFQMIMRESYRGEISKSKTSD